MDHKTFSAFTLKSDVQQGIVESIVAVMGNDDQGDDVIHPGAFLKTIAERRGKIRVLDQHQTDSVTRAVGKPLEMREIGREQLPPDLLMRYPMATGGLYTKTQYLLNTPEGKGVFDRIVAGVIDEYSIGYDPLDVDYSKIKKADGTEKTVRNLRTVRLYEYSPVLWGMNSATATLSAKDATSAAKESTTSKDAKPWNVFKDGEKWNVYKIDADGKPIGEALGTHDTEPEARAQVRALYAAEGKSIKAAQSFSDAFGAMMNERALNEIRWQIDCALSESLMSIAKDAALDIPAKETAWRASLTQYADSLIDWYRRAVESGMIEQESENEIDMMMRMYLQHAPETKSGRIFAARNLTRLQQVKDLVEALLADAATVTEEDMPDMPEHAPAPNGKRAADPRDENAQAGPSTTPTTETLLQSLDIELAELKLMEV